MPQEQAAFTEVCANDAHLAALVARLGTTWLESAADRHPSLSGDPFATLVRLIIGQQVSTLAAAAMFARLRARFGGRLPTPREILDAESEPLRVAAGLSHAKLRYLRSLAQHVLDGRLRLDELGSLPDAEVTRRLTAVTGLGRWSADLFLIFALDRPDVAASGDLAVRRAVMLAYELEAVPTIAEVDRLADRWRPHRSLVCELLWHSQHVSPVVAESAGERRAG